MKAILAALFAGLLATGAVLADPVEGLWQTKPDDNGNFGHIRIKTCGDTICGVLERGFDASGTEQPTPDLGRQIVWDMRAAGEGAYRRGKIWAPDRDRTYNAKMDLDGDILDVSGCVLGFCRASRWTRVAE